MEVQKQKRMLIVSAQVYYFDLAISWTALEDEQSERLKTCPPSQYIPYDNMAVSISIFIIPIRPYSEFLACAVLVRNALAETR